MDKVYYLLISFYLAITIKKTDVQTSMKKNVFDFEYHIEFVKNMHTVYYLIISLEILTIIKSTNVEISIIKNVFYFEYHR